MIRILILLLCLSNLLACNDAETNKEEGNTTEHTHQNSEAPMLTLNNGVKWDSDESTNKNVSELESMMHRWHENKNKALPDYQKAGNELQAGLDKMIRECRMKGPDHDALHLWLEPLLKNVSELNKTTSEKEAENVFHQIDGRIKSYHQYFE